MDFTRCTPSAATILQAARELYDATTWAVGDADVWTCLGIVAGRLDATAHAERLAANALAAVLRDEDVSRAFVLASERVRARRGDLDAWLDDWYAQDRRLIPARVA